MSFRPPFSAKKKLLPLRSQDEFEPELEVQPDGQTQGLLPQGVKSTHILVSESKHVM